MASHVVSPWSPQHSGSEVIQPHRQEGGQRCGSLVRVAPVPREKRKWSPVLSGSQHLGCLLCQLLIDTCFMLHPSRFWDTSRSKAHGGLGGETYKLVTNQWTGWFHILVSVGRAHDQWWQAWHLGGGPPGQGFSDRGLSLEVFRQDEGRGGWT